MIKWLRKSDADGTIASDAGAAMDIGPAETSESIDPFQYERLAQAALRDKTPAISPIGKLSDRLIRFRLSRVCLFGRHLVESLTPTCSGAWPLQSDRSTKA